ncbi:MAG: M48 family metallopeptidase [Firmicutes bacterium]|nr:M48 family metallopeptidase [Bacillota bacterium]
MAKLILDDLEVEVIRKNIKHIYLSVQPPGDRVRMTVPSRIDQETIVIFARSKLDWIRKQQAKLRARPVQPDFEYVNGESHLYFGKPYLLKVVATSGRQRVELSAEGSMNLYVRPSSTRDERQRVLRVWYRRQLQAAIPTYIEKWEKRIGVSVQEWKVRQMKTKWGSCNIQARRIWLNLELVKKSPRCLEYIIVHEMIHLLERYHNARFYSYLTKYLPDWKERRKELNSSG